MSPKAGLTIFSNAKVCRTGADSKHLQFAECLVVKDGLVDFIGSQTDPAVSAAKDAGATVHDLDGQTMLPGFVDGHVHTLMLGQSLTKVALDGCKNLEEIRDRIQKYASANPKVPRIFCRGWMHSMTPDGVDASMLDDLDPRPIFVDAKDLHSTWANTAAIQDVCREFGYDKDTPDPAGGSFQRDVHGELNGLFSESAVFEVIWPFVARVSSLEARKEAIRAAIKAYNSVGYTGMVDMAMDELIWEPLLEIRKEDGGKLHGIRVAAYWLLKPATTTEEIHAQVDRAAEIAKEYNADTAQDCRVVGLKIICDGIIDSCTASLKEPYRTGESSDPIWREEQLDVAVARAHAAGLQVALHAIGDNTIRMAIDVLERNTNASMRPRVEHIEVCTESDAKRLGALGITASIQAVHSDPAILRAWPRLLGETRCKRAFAYRDFADAGAAIALGSDAPTAPHDPLPNMYIATTRRSAREVDLESTVNPEQALSVCQAVVGATRGSAYSCFADAWTGQLKRGMKADFVVCDIELTPDQLIKGVVKETWFEGECVYHK